MESQRKDAQTTGVFSLVSCSWFEPGFLRRQKVVRWSDTTRRSLLRALLSEEGEAAIQSPEPKLEPNTTEVNASVFVLGWPVPLKL